MLLDAGCGSLLDFGKGKYLAEGTEGSEFPAGRHDVLGQRGLQGARAGDGGCGCAVEIDQPPSS